jgi:predicted metalloprotease with PDZ domain
LALSGNYDWFYEGFTIYHALRTGVELNQIRFEDFLNTLGQAYRMEQRLSEGNNLSLIEASQKRWTTSSNFIYAKGLAVAFLCDVALLRASKGKRNLKDIFYKVYQKHRFPNQIQDGSPAILGILKTFPELSLIIQNYLEGKSQIEWKNDLAMIGVELNGTQLKVVQNPNGRQKDLLDKLGYNQWRKLGQKTK